MENTIPKHVAIIMDGNGRWAQKRGLPRNMGHRKGSENLLKIIRHANKIKIEYLTVFAFSTENWKRPKDEVDYLMELPFRFLENNEKEFENKDIKVNVIGKKERLSKKVIDKIKEIENKTKNNNGLRLIVAFNYGGRAEIIDAINKAKENNEALTEETFSEYLYTKDIPDVDFLIRTSGEYRVSNFLLWQSAYSELYFTDVLWPDFNQRHFEKALKEYSKRNRRYGGLS